MNPLVSYVKKTDLEALKSFLCKSYGALFRVKGVFLFSWQYQKHPLDNYNPGVIVKHESKIVAHEALYHDIIKINHKEQVVTWGTDLIVTPEYRRKGIAKTIHDFIFEHEDIYVAIAMAGNTANLLKQYQHIELDPVYTFVSPLSNSFIKKDQNTQRIFKYNYGLLGKAIFWLQKKGLNKSFSWLIDSKVFSTNKFDKVQANKVILKEDFLSDRFLHFRSQFERKQNNIHIYTPEIIKWKFKEQPNKNFELHCLIDKEKINGYVILRIHQDGNEKTGIISDVAAESYDNYDLLVKFTQSYFQKMGCSSVYILTAIHEIEKTLIANSFLKTNRRVPILISRHEKNLELKGRSFYFNYESHDLDRPYNVRF